MTRKLIVKLLPNTERKVRWYYTEYYAHWIDNEITVTELENEPIFEGSYRYDDSLFIDKSDCVIVKEL